MRQAVPARRLARALGVVLLAGLAGGGVLGGCTVGQGSGAADGLLFVDACNGGTPFGGSEGLHPFHLDPTFFAGEPFDNIGGADPANRLVIRMQREGTRIEVNDVLYFDIRDVQQVARCVRGVDADGNPNQAAALPWCDWSRTSCCDPGDAACLAYPGPCIMVSPDYPVTVSIQLLFSCGSISPTTPTNSVGVAESGSVVGQTMWSWIEFSNFGAIEPDTANLGGIGKTFKVDFGQPLRATFHVEMEDERVVTAVKDMDVLLPDAVIGGVLDGNFDFQLERGRAAQPFP